MPLRLTAIDVDDHVSRGQGIYERLKSKLEPEHTGEVVAIDIDSSDYFLGKTVVDEVQEARKKYPDRIFHTVRIGSKAVHSRR